MEKPTTTYVYTHTERERERDTSLSIFYILIEKREQQQQQQQQSETLSKRRRGMERLLRSRARRSPLFFPFFSIKISRYVYASPCSTTVILPLLPFFSHYCYRLIDYCRCWCCCCSFVCEEATHCLFVRCRVFRIILNWGNGSLSSSARSLYFLPLLLLLLLLVLMVMHNAFLDAHWYLRCMPGK